MIRLDCDYMRGCHPEVLQKLVDTNMEQHAGYGFDSYTRRGEKAILNACGLTDGDVSILTGGTQTNAVVLDALLAKGCFTAVMMHGFEGVYEVCGNPAYMDKFVRNPNYAWTNRAVTKRMLSNGFTFSRQ